jgi:hypothetical protein
MFRLGFVHTTPSAFKAAIPGRKGLAVPKAVSKLFDVEPLKFFDPTRCDL